MVIHTGYERPINIVGGGLAGALLAVMLVRRGCGAIHVWDKRADPRRARSERGRSINLVLAARGIRALEKAGVMGRVEPLMIPLRGRMIHERSGSTSLQPYGQRDDELIYSIGRADLNRVLIEEAARHQDVTIRFNQTCLGADCQRNQLEFRNDTSGALYSLELAPTLATDGAGSALRTSLAKAGHLRCREEWLDHDYKELTIPPAGGRPAIDPNALHIWPRGGFMLIALPNTDQSFTATLFLSRTGPRSFASLPNARAVSALFREEFPDAAELMPDLVSEFQAHPTGQLGTVHADRWHAGGQVLLMGDAAHAIVPFHGQGMNAAFEDCRVLDSLLDRYSDWESLFAEFERLRRPNAEAIAQMALENYREMRETVLDPGFVRRRTMALELERHFPDRFVPRYSMVMFRSDIPYSEALRRGGVQEEILLELDGLRNAAGVTDADAARLSATDLERAAELINARLPPVSPA
jgi:kynurenine 3-monooxygenase